MTTGVLTAIGGVMHDICQTGIGKGRTNKDQNYKFRGIDDMLNALSPLFTKHKLVIVPKVLKRELVQAATKSGGTMWKVTVEVEYTVYGPDGTSLVASTFGEAMDSADKATNKALSAAYKYLVIQLFAIPVDGQPDADADTPEVEPVVTTAQAKTIKALLKSLGVDESALLTWVSGHAGHEVAAVEMIPAHGYEAVVASLNKRRESKEGVAA